jgi:hypothetical protein
MLDNNCKMKNFFYEHEYDILMWIGNCLARWWYCRVFPRESVGEGTQEAMGLWPSQARRRK